MDTAEFHIVRSDEIDCRDLLFRVEDLRLTDLRPRLHGAGVPLLGQRRHGPADGRHPDHRQARNCESLRRVHRLSDYGPGRPDARRLGA